MQKRVQNAPHLPKNIAISSKMFIMFIHKVIPYNPTLNKGKPMDIQDFDKFTALLSEAMICTDEAFNITHFNKAAEQCFGAMKNRNLSSLSQALHISPPLDQLCKELPINTTKNFSITYQDNKKNKSQTSNWRISALSNKSGSNSYVLLSDLPITIKEHVDYLQNIVDCTPGSLYWKDKEGTYLGCNEYMAKMIGLNSSKEIVGKKDPELHGADKSNDLLHHDKVVMNDRQTITIEEDVVCANGERKTFMAVKMPLKNDADNVIGIVGNSVDITELKHLQQDLKKAKDKAEDANQIKSDFIASISHDLRTPLNALLGASQILNIKDHYPEQQEFIDIIVIAAQNLLNIVEDILSFSKIEAGKNELTFDSFNIHEMIKGICQMMQYYAEQKELTLSYEIDSSIPQMVIGAHSAVRRILLNLINNAIKFTHKGNILIKLENESSNQKSTVIKISISDSGIGIPANKREYIFERFAQLTPSYKGRYEGVGLGLSIVKNLMDNLGGTITLESEENKGSCFSCNIPFEQQQDTSGVNIAMQFAYSNVRVLLIKDETNKNIQLQSALPSEVTVSSSEKAEKIIQEYQTRNIPFHIIIIDSTKAYSVCNQLCQSPELEDTLMLISKDQAKDLPTDTTQNFFDNIDINLSSHDLIVQLKTIWDQWLKHRTQSSIRKEHIIKVLLIENDQASQSVCKTMLEDFGCQVDIADSGQYGIELFKNNTYDIAFLDIGLGDMSGFDIAKEMRNIEQSSKPIPIIALTAHAFENYEKKSIKAGMNDFLTKPAIYEDFKKILNKFIFSSLNKKTTV